MKPGKHAYPSVHRGIVRAAAYLLDDDFFTAQDIETLVASAALPDKKGDRLNGRGMHYYCAGKPDGGCGIPDSAGHFANGRGFYRPTPLTMFEGEWISAISLYQADHRAAALDALSRAAHFLADVCCPPHSCGLTYFSKYGSFHKLYEARAAAVFWEEQPVSDEAPAARRWAERCDTEALPQYDFSDAGALFAMLAKESAAQLPAVIGGTEAETDTSIRAQLSIAIRSVAALLRCFSAETKSPARRLDADRFYTWGGMQLKLQPCEDGLYHLVSEDGRYLRTAMFGRVRLGAEPMQFGLGIQGDGCYLHPDGDVWRVVGEKNGRLHGCRVRRKHCGVCALKLK
ncbi:MAG: hypothetical protein E7501_04710 [Ruminococcus sp.]|nr:hypothetical protein [Ruminococcus sp.]